MGKRVVISGASGFIGKALVQYFLEKGWEVIALVRNIPSNIGEENLSFVKYDLGGDHAAMVEVLRNADCLVHAAYVKHVAGGTADAVNKNGTESLLKICRAENTRLVYLSTMSAHEDALSHYGKSKANLEKLFDGNNEVVLKLGLVVGRGGGLFGEISKILAKSKFIPMIDGGNQPIHALSLQDLAEVVFQSATSEQLAEKTYYVGEKKSRTLRSLYQVIAHNAGNEVKFVNLPYKLMQALVWVISKVPVGPDISNENLLGLRQLKSFESEADQFFPLVNCKPLEEFISDLDNSA